MKGINNIFEYHGNQMPASPTSHYIYQRYNSLGYAVYTSTMDVDGEALFQANMNAYSPYLEEFRANLSSFTTPYTIYAGAFSHCEKLISFYAPVASVYGNYAFYGCHNLSDVDLGSSCSYIGMWAFQDCYRLSSINLMNVTRVKAGAFSSTNISYAEFGPCSYIEYGAFDSTPLMTLVFNWSSITWIDFQQGNLNCPLYYSGSIYVPDSLYSSYVSLYQNAVDPEWSPQEDIDFWQRFVSMSLKP